MTIPDEAVQAALATLDEDDTYVSEADHLWQFVIDGPVNIKAMLTAALPFLQGVKADPWGWVIPRGGSKKPIILEASKFDQASAAAEADIHDLGYFPIYTQPVSSPSPRAQALEEAARKHLKWFERFICDQDELNSSTPRKVAQNAQDAADELRAALSSPDHADAGKVEGDGWLPIETAPKDGTEFIGWDGKWPFRCSAGKKYELYPHMDGGPTYRDVWDGHYYDSLTIEHPTHWRPLPSSPGASATRPNGGSNHGE